MRDMIISMLEGADEKQLQTIYFFVRGLLRMD